MKDEERVVEVECEACKGSGYLCECESDGVVNRYPNSEECDYCPLRRRDKYKYICNYCEGRGVVEEVEHYAVEG
jgi:DnaJ-class molecular chaperone